MSLCFLVWGIKKWLTHLRIGYVKFSETRRRRITARFVVLWVVMLLIGVMAALLWGIGTRVEWLADYFPLIFNEKVAAVLCFVAYWARVNRFYRRATLSFLGAALYLWLGIRWEFGFTGAGGIVVLIGLGILVSVLHKYPRMIEEVHSEDR